MGRLYLGILSKVNLMYILAHFMDPTDLHILANLAKNFLSGGNCQEALKCAETVLVKVGSHSLLHIGKYLFRNRRIFKQSLSRQRLFTVCASLNMHLPCFQRFLPLLLPYIKGLGYQLCYRV